MQKDQIKLKMLKLKRYKKFKYSWLEKHPKTSVLRYKMGSINKKSRKTQKFGPAIKVEH